jgi:hypothetical protein
MFLNRNPSQEERPIRNLAPGPTYKYLTSFQFSQSDTFFVSIRKRAFQGPNGRRVLDRPFQLTRPQLCATGGESTPVFLFLFFTKIFLIESIIGMPIVKRRACVTCTNAKCKCSPQSDNLCQRCARLGKQCVYLDLPQRKRKRKDDEDK